MRGSLSDAPLSGLFGRSIPASAGQPSARQRVSVAGRVYPRECGAAVILTSAATSMPGLSPRVRGSRKHCSTSLIRLRSIPASAGQPEKGRISPSQAWVYPRECGAATRWGGCDARSRGLSPRVRGSPIEEISQMFRGGSIPASAGQPIPIGGALCAIRVYPRECGAASQRLFLEHAAEGLSPRVRGSHQLRRVEGHAPGSIPASAGQPFSRHPITIPLRVYPRECGAALRYGGLSVRVWGLSPRVRGSLCFL